MLRQPTLAYLASVEMSGTTPADEETTESIRGDPDDTSGQDEREQVRDHYRILSHADGRNAATTARLGSSACRGGKDASGNAHADANAACTEIGFVNPKSVFFGNYITRTPTGGLSAMK